MIVCIVCWIAQVQRKTIETFAFYVDLAGKDLAGKDLTGQKFLDALESGEEFHDILNSPPSDRRQ
jgi:hypothetical protein